MDNLSTSEPSVASTETAASPAATADSSVSVEANQPAQPVADATPAPSVPANDANGSSSTAQDEWPDEAAMQAMSGQERSSHWQRVRARIDELNQQLAEREAQLANFQQQPPPESSNWVKPDLLFAPVIDPQTGQPAVDEYGEPVTTPQPFIEQLRNESPSTFAEMVFQALNQPWNDQESTARVLFRDYFGLNPALIETYRQIQSPEDAQAYVTPPADMSHIPQQYHDLYKSLDWETRDQIDSILDEPARNLALRGLHAEFEQKQADARREAERQAERRQLAEQRAAALGEEIATGARTLVRQQFEKSAQLTGEPETDKLIWDVLMTYSEGMLLSDSQAKPVIDRLYNPETGLIHKGEAHLARSQQTLLAANAARLLKQPLEMLSGLAADARKWREHQRQTAAPRTELGANGATGLNQQPANSNTGLQTQPNGRSALFNADEIAQLAAQIRASQAAL